jgi:hypothetical protein
MELLPHNELGRLRMGHFLGSPRDIGVDSWAYLDELWVGESLGFTEFLRPRAQPHVVRCVGIALTELPTHVGRQILAALKLPLHTGMTLSQLVHALGEPASAHSFIDDRITLEFAVGERWPYLVECTALDDGGLIYVVLRARGRGDA